MMYKKAESSLGGWTQTLILLTLFVFLFAAIVTIMNGEYGQEHSVGLDTSLVDPEGTFSEYSVTAQGYVEGGEATQTSDGFSLTSSWALTKGVWNALWGVVSGNFINIIVVDYMGMPEAVGFALRLMFLIGLVFALIKLFFGRTEV